MIKRTIYTFDLPIVDEMSVPEYVSLIDAIRAMKPDGDIDGKSIKSHLYQITVETVESP